jgi:hypothetical protein
LTSVISVGAAASPASWRTRRDYPIDHFGGFLGDDFERVAADQIEFLRRHGLGGRVLRRPPPAKARHNRKRSVSASSICSRKNLRSDGGMNARMSARRYECSARVYGVDERVDDFDCFVEVGDRHVEAAGHGGVAVAPVGVGRDVRWPGLPATCGEYALAGVLDGREVLSGQGLE